MGRRRTTISGSSACAGFRARNGHSDVVNVVVLGRLELRRAERRVDIRRPAQRRIAALLLLERGSSVPVDVLIERFWTGTPPPSARRAIHTHVSEVRRLGGHDLIETTDDGYRWRTHGCRVDAERFESAVRTASTEWSSGNHDAVVRAAADAGRMWVDPPFADLADDEFARPVIERLRSLARQAAELQACALLELGRASEAIPDLAEASLANPLDERFGLLLARALLESGRPADALRALERVRHELAAAGLVPGAEWSELECSILQGRTRANLRTAS